MRRWGVALALLLLAACEPDPVRPGPGPPGSSASGSETVADPWAGYASGWSRLLEPPARRSGAAWAWVGDEVLVVGGCDPRVEDECRETRRAAAFDPETRSWHRAPSAVEPMTGAQAVSIGDATIFLETYPGEPEPIVGQAYESSTRTWREIADAPLDRAYGVVSVWTGEELILWGGGERGEARTFEGASYDPETDSWRRIADAPIGLNAADAVWTGAEALVFGSLLSGANRAPMPTSVGAAYDPATDSWRELPPSALSPQATSAVWLGERLVAWDYEVHSQEYDPIADRWTAPVRMPMSFSECYPNSATASGLLFAWFCGRAALYDVGVHGWERLDGGPLDETVYSEAYERELPVWRFADLVDAGSAIVMPMEGLTLNRRGIACFGCDDSPVSVWVYRPPEEIVPDRSFESPSRRDVQTAVADFLYAVMFDVQGKLRWLATTGGLATFDARVPDLGIRSSYRIDRVRAMDDEGFFEVETVLSIRDSPGGEADVVRYPTTLVFGPGTSIGGDPSPLLLVHVRHRAP